MNNTDTIIQHAEQHCGVPQFLIYGECNGVKEINIKPATIKELQTAIDQARFKLISPQFEMNCIGADCLAHAA